MPKRTFFLFAILIVLSSDFALSQGLKLVLVEEHPIHDVLVHDMVPFAVSQEFYFLPGIEGHSIHRYNRITRSIDKANSGKGGGPNEFASEIISLHGLSDRFLVSQKNGEITYFTTDLKFIRKTVAAQGLNNFSSIDGNNEQFISCVSSLVDYNETGAIDNLALITIQDKVTININMFDLPVTQENINLQRCRQDSNGKFVVSGRQGDHLIYFQKLDGTFIRSVQITNAVKHTFGNSPPGADMVYSKYGITDTRSVSSGVVHKIVTDENYTVVQGGISAEKMLRTLYIVDHNTWQVSTVNLPTGYRQLAFENGKLICLNTKTSPHQIDVFVIAQY